MKKTKKLDQNTTTIVFIIICVAFCVWCIISSIVDGVKSDIKENGVQTPEIIEDAVNDFGIVSDFAKEFEKEANGVNIDKIADSFEPTSEATGD